jgi:hypothetical protein
MTAQNENQDTVQPSAHNPFPEPQTIPSGWDTSGFFSAIEPLDIARNQPASTKEEEVSAES